MTTFAALTITEGQARADALSDACVNLLPEPVGVGVFEIEDGSGQWEVCAYFTESPDRAGLMLLAAVHEAQDWRISELPDEDWVAKVRRELSPVEAGRFFVYGSHDADKVPAGKEPLLIEAAMAFGTGHHGTTLGCLRALDRLIDLGARKKAVADIGCGTAVLAMAAARIWPETVLASDIDPVAIDVALANAAANGLAGRIETVVAPGFDAPRLREAGPFDLVFANILKGPLIALASDMAASVAPGGHAILSGILVEQADEIAAVYGSQGFDHAHRDDIGEWTTLTLVRS